MDKFCSAIPLLIENQYYQCVNTHHRKKYYQNTIKHSNHRLDPLNFQITCQRERYYKFRVVAVVWIEVLSASNEEELNEGELGYWGTRIGN